MLFRPTIQPETHLYFIFLRKLFYDHVNYRVNTAEIQIFLKPFLYNARLESKMEGWGKKGVQTMVVLYTNSCYNGPCCSEVQVFSSSFIAVMYWSYVNTPPPSSSENLWGNDFFDHPCSVREVPGL